MMSPLRATSYGPMPLRSPTTTGPTVSRTTTTLAKIVRLCLGQLVAQEPASGADGTIRAASVFRRRCVRVWNHSIRRRYRHPQLRHRRHHHRHPRCLYRHHAFRTARLSPPHSSSAWKVVTLRSLPMIVPPLPATCARASRVFLPALLHVPSWLPLPHCTLVLACA